MLDFEIDHLIKEENGQIDAYVKVFKVGDPEKVLKTYCIVYKDVISFKAKLKEKIGQLRKDVEELALKEAEINTSLEELKREVEK